MAKAKDGGYVGVSYARFALLDAMTGKALTSGFQVLMLMAFTRLRHLKMVVLLVRPYPGWHLLLPAFGGTTLLPIFQSARLNQVLH